MNSYKMRISYTTGPQHPAISVVENEDNCRPEVIINYSKRLFIIKNRETIIRIFCNNLHSIKDEMIDELVEGKTNKERNKNENE